MYWWGNQRNSYFGDILVRWEEGCVYFPMVEIFLIQKTSGLEQRPTEKMQKLFGGTEGCGIKMGRAVKQDCG